MPDRPSWAREARQAYRTLEVANQNARGLMRFGRPEQQGAIIEELCAGLEAAQRALGAILTALGEDDESGPRADDEPRLRAEPGRDVLSLSLPSASPAPPH